jgi:predicted KAP-like P-loop ATPase
MLQPVMTAENTFDKDRPITSPEQDEFGMQPFAEYLATVLLNMDASEGMVISLEGEWGSGKTSAIELTIREMMIRELAEIKCFSLSDAKEYYQNRSVLDNDWYRYSKQSINCDIKDTSFQIIKFDPWDFSGQEPIENAFFREISKKIDKNHSCKEWLKDNRETFVPGGVGSVP